MNKIVGVLRFSSKVLLRNRIFNSKLECKHNLYSVAESYVKNTSNNTLIHSTFKKSYLKMSQRSITSFFTKTPKKNCDTSDQESSKKSVKRERDSSVESELNKSPEIVNGDGKKSKVKRQRMKSDDSEGSSKKSPSPKGSPVKTVKKTPKRQRIESSSSDSNSPVKKSPEPKEESPKPVKAEPVTPTITKKSPASNKKSPASNKKSPTSNKKTSASKSVSEIVVDNKKKSPISPKKELSSKKPQSQKNVVLTDKTNKKEGDSVLEKVSEADYNPSKVKYDPIKDACWIKDQKVPYLALAKTLECIENTSARLKIVEILSNYFRSVLVLCPEDLLPSVYMCLNQLAPAYENVELGVAETYLMKAIGQSTGKTLAQMKASVSKTGDLGLVAEQARTTQRTMFQPAPLTVRGVFTELRQLAQMTGQASVNKKISKIQSIFIACRQSEARYFIRSLAGKLRIGLAEQSVLQALALATVTTPPLQEYPPTILDASKGISTEEFKAKLDKQALIIKTTYCECPNYDLIIPVILKHGVSALPEHCKLTPGIPLKPMLAHPTKGVHEVFQRFENIKFTCEWKYDGERAQIHIPSDSEGHVDLARASIFSRNQERNTSKYPDVIARLDRALKDTVHSCVLDCEAVAWDREKRQILPFQILSTRKRKDANVEDIKVQVCLFLFDLLYLNGKPLVSEPLQERRRLLKENFNEVEGEWLFATCKDCSTMDEVQEFLEESVKGSCEGLMVKSLCGQDATYEIAKRSRNWLKLKKDYLESGGDSLDVVVLGAYLGRGKRAGAFGGFLLACYDPQNEEYQSLCKIGTGFTDDDLQKHTETLEEHRIESPPNYYRYDQSHKPDVWFSPAAVWEIRCADLSLSPVHRAGAGLVDAEKGISLRFPRFVRIREDKTPEEATTAQQIAEIYLNQDQVKNQGNVKKDFEEDFY